MGIAVQCTHPTSRVAIASFSKIRFVIRPEEQDFPDTMPRVSKNTSAPKKAFSVKIKEEPFEIVPEMKPTKRGQPKITKMEDNLNLRKIDNKSQNIRKRRVGHSENASGGLSGLGKFYQGLQGLGPAGAALTSTVRQVMPHAVDQLTQVLPQVAKHALPWAIKLIAPGVLGGAMYSMASESVMPYLLDTLIPEDVRLEVARRRSLRDSTAD